MFKRGDKVRCIKYDNDSAGGSGWQEGYEFIITGIDKSFDDRGQICWGGHNTNGVYSNYLELVNNKGTSRHKATKPRPVNFLLKYDLDEDPIEEFETMAQVKERIDYLVQNERSLKRDSIVVYTIKKKQRVTVKTNISLHA